MHPHEVLSFIEPILNYYDIYSKGDDDDDHDSYDDDYDYDADSGDDDDGDDYDYDIYHCCYLNHLYSITN
jgi:hypothetical protein